MTALPSRSPGALVAPTITEGVSVAFLDSGGDAPDGAPFILLRPDGGDVWMLRLEGPMPVGTPQEMVEVAVRAGFVDPE
ncbi:hypothetical protein [Streptomyces californicus]|uniref:hypothetical protein n=1 Tax=Streptomyces californicus TaxID=67351 RepID=UPI0037AA5410